MIYAANLIYDQSGEQERQARKMSAPTLFANRATFDHFSREWSYHAIFANDG